MKLSILHISDLHRDTENPLRNAPLLDSLQTDRQRYTQQENRAVRPPDLILVSGDIIQGVRQDAANAEHQLKQQYNEALSFLNQLTNTFLGGNKQCIVLVPGNHDISAFHFFSSLQKIDIAPDRKKELVEQLFLRNSLLRWSWSNFQLYKIVNSDLYARRLAAFSDFYREFYGDARTYSLDPEKQFDIFDLPHFNLTIVGFNSCFNNDLLNKQGDIHPDCIGEASIRLRDPQYRNRLRIAVWHHNTEGLPNHTDYLDPDILQNLIDRGFSLGFHGHQHKPQFLDTKFRYQGSRRLTVISAGTLCGGASYRFARAYNVVEIDTEEMKGLLHLREMQNDNLQLPIWGRRSLPPSTDSHIEFSFDPPPEPLTAPDVHTATLIDAQDLYAKGKYMEAAQLLIPIAQSDALGKRLLLECLANANDAKGIIQFFDPPTGAAEAISLIDALWKEGKRDRLRQILAEPLVAKSSDPSVVELRNKYVGRLSK